MVINFSVRSFCILKMPPLCHPSSTGAATSCLVGGSSLQELQPCPRGWGDVPDASWWNLGAAHFHGLALSLREWWLSVPNHTPSYRAGYCQLVSQVFSIISFFCFLVLVVFVVVVVGFFGVFFCFYILCSNKVTVARISFVCGLAVLKSHPDILLSTPWCFYCSYKQQTVKWALQ